MISGRYSVSRCKSIASIIFRIGLLLPFRMLHKAHVSPDRRKCSWSRARQHYGNFLEASVGAPGGWSDFSARTAITVTPPHTITVQSVFEKSRTQTEQWKSLSSSSLEETRRSSMETMPLIGRSFRIASTIYGENLVLRPKSPQPNTQTKQ